MFIFEDPPQHTMHRGLLSRVFTPKKMLALEPEVREFCARCLDPFVGSDGFDFVQDFAAIVAARVIGMLLGIPERDQMAVQERQASRRAPGAKDADLSHFDGAMFAEYIEWREEHPSDDLMTALLQAEFQDETGTTRRLTRTEILTSVNLLAGAGNDTTAKLIGWSGKLLSDHPEQRKLLVEDPGSHPQRRRGDPPLRDPGDAERPLCRRGRRDLPVASFLPGPRSSASWRRRTATSVGSPNPTASTSAADRRAS